MKATPLPPLLKVLLVLPYEPAPFMQADIAILDRHFELDTITHNRGKRRLFLSVARRLLFDRPDVLLMWFIVPSYALALTLMAKVCGVKVAFITGGYDVVSMPRIGFGAMRFPLFRGMLRPTLALADLVLPFSEAAAQHVAKYSRARHVTVLYPGVDTVFFTPPPPGSQREPLALTVSPVIKESIAQKGLDTFVAAARLAPEIRFVLVGTSPDGSLESLRRGAPSNVEFIDRFLPAIELRELYRRASCYVQASRHEGFGVAVAEAMACGAVPVVTQRFSLPEVTGGLGQYIPVGDAVATAAAVRESSRIPTPARMALRKRVMTHFPLARRETELVTLLLGLAPGRRRLSVEATIHAPIKLDLGCGSLERPGFIGIDARPTRATRIVADAQQLPLGPGMADEIFATCLLEHFDAPTQVLDEVHRVLKPTGRAVLRLPNLGTYSSHLDTTHRFLADLSLWRTLFNGYFHQVEVRP
ncbi:MAG TPA: glycosyltransferase, partial [Chloroflexia bacterium]|nr:glycosyltransferase [Chloroflexia bacterium]